MLSTSLLVTLLLLLTATDCYYHRAASPTAVFNVTTIMYTSPLTTGSPAVPVLLAKPMTIMIDPRSTSTTVSRPTAANGFQCLTVLFFNKSVKAM
jgi:hypothetical protein